MAPIDEQFHVLSTEWNDKVKKYFLGHSDGFVESSDGRLVIPPRYLKLKDKIMNMTLRPTDVWIVTYPKCGTTWTQELLWLLQNDCDTKTAAEQSLMQRVHFIEFDGILTDAVHEQMLAASVDGKKFTGCTVEEIDGIPEDQPRMIKSHLPIHMLPKNLIDICKVVYVARNPRDVAVSYYHHCKLINVHGFQGDFEQFFDLFINGKVCYGPFWEHALEGYSYKDRDNFLFLFFEDMKKDLPREIRKVADFLMKSIDENTIMRLAEFLSFDKCKERWQQYEDAIKQTGAIAKEGNFYRKGVVGDHVNYLTPDMMSKMKTLEDLYLKDSTLRFPYH